MATDHTEQMSGGEAVVKQLEQEGVEHVFGIPGVHTLDIYDALIESDITHFTTRHEQGAGFMADGYARTTDGIGVMLVITGPGLTNAATPIAQAYSDSSPVLVISSDNETDQRGQGKGLLHELKDQDAVMDAMTEFSKTITTVEDIPSEISGAFSYLRAHRPRAVHLQIPLDVLGRNEPVSSIPDPTSHEEPIVDSDRIAEAVTLLENSERPVVIAGGGAIGAAHELREIITQTQLPTVTTAAGKGVVPESNPLSLGARLREEAVSAFVESCDLALAVGTELSPLDLRGTELPDTLVHVDIDYEAINRNQTAHLGIVGDARAACENLLAQLKTTTIDVDPRIHDELQSIRASWDTPHTDSEDDREVILATLRESLEDNAITVFDMTKVGYLGRRLFPVNEPGTFVFPRGFGTLGFSPPAAYGAKIGNPSRQVVAIVGDGGSMFTIQDLATAVKYDVSVPVIICNDESYGVIGDHQNREYGRTTANHITNPDFVQLAQAFGASGTRIDVNDVPNQLPTALEKAFDRAGPTVIEITLEPGLE